MLLELRGLWGIFPSRNIMVLSLIKEKKKSPNSAAKNNALCRENRFDISHILQDIWRC